MTKTVIFISAPPSADAGLDRDDISLAEGGQLADAKPTLVEVEQRLRTETLVQVRDDVVRVVEPARIAVLLNAN